MSVFETPKVNHPCHVPVPVPRLSPNDLNDWDAHWKSVLPREKREDNLSLRAIDEIRYCWALIEGMARTIEGQRREIQVLRNQRWASMRKEEQAQKLVASKAKEQRRGRRRAP